MIHWAWIPVALFGGAFLGFFTAALCVAASEADDRMERAMRARAFTAGDFELPHFVDPDQFDMEEIVNLPAYAESRGQGPRDQAS